MLAGRYFRSWAERLISFLAVLTPLCLALVMPLPSYAQSVLVAPQLWLPPSGSYSGAVSLDPAFLDSSYMFRFSSSSPWRPLDRVLVLDAFPGEYRRYRLELLSNMSGDISSIEYIIDRKPPETPVFLPVSGDIGSTLTVGLRGEGSFMLSLNGSPFTPYDPATPIIIHAPADGSSIITGLAFALDEHGNASLPAFAKWRLSRLNPESLPFFDVSMQIEAELRILEKVEGLSLRVSAEPGANPVVILDVPDGRIPVISVQSSRDEVSKASFIRMIPSAGRARAEIPVPWGYDLELAIRYGYEDRDGIVVIGKASLVRADFPYRSPPAPPVKAPEPVLSSAFGATVLSWPPSVTEQYFSIDGSVFTRYHAPILLPYRGPTPYELSYQAANAGGRSVPVVMFVQVLPRMEAPAIRGVEAGLTYGSGPNIKADATYGTVRFEMTMDGTEPMPPGGTSPVMDDAATFAGVDGRFIHYRLRLAAVDDDGVVGPERYLDFAVDREPPPVPTLAHFLPAYSTNDLNLALKQPETDDFIYLSVTDDEVAEFQEYRGPVVLSGSDDSRKRYVVRAFAEDAFGNRSAEMPPLAILVDRASLYVDPIGKNGASGTPHDPLPSLQEALMASAASGRKTIYLRGNHVLGGPIQVVDGLRLFGGFAPDWTSSPGEHVSIRFSRALTSGAAGLRIRGGFLELRSVGLVAEGSGVSVLVDAKDSSLVLAHVSLGLSGGLEATAIRVDSSKLVMDSVDISISSVVTGRALDTIDSDCTLGQLVVVADSSVRLFDALRIVGGKSRIQNLRVDARPGLAFSGLSLSRAQVAISGSAFLVKGGASTLRLLNLNAASLTIDTLFGDIAWLGEAELFRLGSSSSLRLAHATVLAKSKRLSVVDSRDSDWSIYNSIFNADSPAAVFAAGEKLPTEGSVSANCLWGFSVYLSGNGRSGSLAELNRYASLGHPNFMEMPSKTFASTNKGLPSLSSSSACIGTAAPLPWSMIEELKMDLGVPANRDIGVDGLREGRL